MDSNAIWYHTWAERKKFWADKPSIICLCSLIQPARPTVIFKALWLKVINAQIEAYKLATNWPRCNAQWETRDPATSCGFTIYEEFFPTTRNNDKDHKNQLRHVCPSTVTRPQTSQRTGPKNSECIFNKFVDVSRVPFPRSLTILWQVIIAWQAA